MLNLMNFWPKRSWFRFHLSTAIIAMLVVALTLGICIQYFHLFEDDFQRTLRASLERKVSRDWNDMPFKDAVFELQNYPIYIFASPELLKPELKITLSVHD